ncbi:MAG: hypothetical protein OXC62_11560 [Aestuariivita sp.]|nr:hypothetical protein [Aestuariivita sp.]
MRLSSVFHNIVHLVLAQVRTGGKLIDIAFIFSEQTDLMGASVIAKTDYFEIMTCQRLK